MNFFPFRTLLAAAFLGLSLPAPYANAQDAPEKLTVKKGDTIVFLGGGMASRMMHFNHFETELYLRFPEARPYHPQHGRRRQHARLPPSPQPRLRGPVSLFPEPRTTPPPRSWSKPEYPAKTPSRKAISRRLTSG